MPVIFGRAGLSCAPSDGQKRQTARKGALWFIRILLDSDMRRDALGNASLLRTRVRAGEFGAAGFFGGFEFHKFDAGLVGIIEVELPFAVAADFGLFGKLEAVRADAFLGGVNVGDADGDVIHDSANPLISIQWDVNHEFEPVSAVRDLQGDPISLVVLHAAVPVRSKTENVLVKVLGGGAVVNDKACVDNVQMVRWARDRFVRDRGNGNTGVLDEANMMPFGVDHREKNVGCSASICPSADLNSLFPESAPQFVDIVRGKPDL